jgi:hypothetical protein
LSATVFDRHPFADWLKESPDPQALDRLLAKKGWRYVLINQEEWRRIEDGPAPHYGYFTGPPQEALFRTWVREHLVPLYSRNGCTLYRVPLAGPSRKEPSPA